MVSRMFDRVSTLFFALFSIFIIINYYNHFYNISMLHIAGLGLRIRGGQPVPTHNGVIGAFVQEIRAGSVAAQLLGELKTGLLFYKAFIENLPNLKWCSLELEAVST